MQIHRADGPSTQTELNHKLAVYRNSNVLCRVCRERFGLYNAVMSDALLHEQSFSL